MVGRDVNQLREMRAIIASALIWSGVLIILAGLACGAALSLGPLRRLRVLQAAGREIAAGDLEAPHAGLAAARDELDMFAGTVNHMMDEVERLMSEVKGVEREHRPRPAHAADPRPRPAAPPAAGARRGDPRGRRSAA